MKQELSNTAINEYDELIMVVGTGNILENQIRITGVTKARFATEYDSLGTYKPFRWT